MPQRLSKKSLFTVIGIYAGSVLVGVSGNFCYDALKSVSPWIATHIANSISIWYAVAIGLAGISTGYLIRWSLEPGNPSTLPGIGGKITVPEDGSHHTKGTVTIQGTFDHDPEPGEKLVVLTSRQGTYYPQSRLTSTGPRSWECLCEEKNAGETKVHVGVCGPRYRDRARHYFDVGKANKGWHGFKLGVPPDDVRFDHTISIHIDSQTE